MSDIAIKVENLSKRYRIGLEEELPDTLVGALTQAVKRPLRNWRRLRRLTRFNDEKRTIDDGRPTTGDSSSIVHRPSSDVRSDVDRDTLWALKDVSFEVQRGEVVGIIGRNGAGKSTLLKILARITHPTSGRAVINGRVGSLLEVGTGFHPELTGRENIYLNGTILGMTKAEVACKFDEIVDFSGVEKFIDTPVKRYSSGMRVRLAFSVAAHLDPEILLVDEVLAVGDAGFQKKCLGKMGEVASEGRTVLFVSHNMAAVESLCRRVICLESGGIITDSSPKEAISLYITQVTDDFPSVDLNSHKGRRQKMKPVLSGIALAKEDDSLANTFQTGDQITFEITLDPKGDSYDYPVISVAVFSHMGVLVCKLASWAQFQHQWKLETQRVVRCTWSDCRLAPGKYYINIGFGNGVEVIDYVENVASFDILEGDLFGTGNTGSGLFIPDAEWIV